MRLYSLIIPSEKENAELYYREKKGVVDCSQDRIKIPKGCTCSFDTYFNCFSYSKLKSLTVLDKIELRVRYTGKAEFSLIACRTTTKFVDEVSSFEFSRRLGNDERIDYSNTDIPCEVLKSVIVEGKDAEVVLSFSLNELNGDGFLYLSATSIDGLEIFEADYYSPEDATFVPKIAVVICTYRREKFLYKNLTCLKTLFESKAYLKDCFEVFVVDNAKTISGLSEYGFAKVYPNKNLGGSGGFCRGIIEACKRKEFNEILLTDDDISFEPEIFCRLYSILSYLRQPGKTAVGAAMLRNDIPSYQHELGAEWRGDRLIPYNHAYRLTEKFDLLCNELPHAVDYSAWWFMCMPVSRINEVGLPFPFFIKCDDVEYGLRGKYDILLLNGIGVWHEPFENKYSPELDYYVKRNELVVNALYMPKLGVCFNFKKLVRAVGKQLVCQHYDAVDFLFLAYNDFLKGADYFSSIDGEALHAKLRSLAPIPLDNSVLAEIGFEIKDKPFFKGKNSFAVKLAQIITLNGYLVPSCFYKKEDRKGRLVDITHLTPRDLFLCSKSIQYNPSTQTGIVCKQKRRKLFSTAIRLVGMFLKLVFRFHSVADEFRNKQKDIYSEQSWRKRFGENYTESDKV